MTKILRTVLFALFAVTGPLEAEVQSAQVLTFDQLEGWDDDDHAAALDIFLQTCPDMVEPDWNSICAMALNPTNPKVFFELFFRPILVSDGADPLFTGYFEPELFGSRVQTGRYQYPVYGPPKHIEGKWPSRREVETTDVMRGRGLEIVWVDDLGALFFAQIQGSARVRLTDGSSIRLGYAAANGYNYRSVGLEMVKRGIYQAHEVSADVIGNWVKRNPTDGPELLRHNPSYVFFAEVTKTKNHQGPLGAMNWPLTALRTIAVDPEYVPLGAPVWIEKDGALKLRRIMIAQDKGSAIKGAQRADIFVGTGVVAGQVAGKIRDTGRLIMLTPIQRAYAMVEESLQ
ncbi:MAG: MltA domain-containing protein [Paracoccaceae bacterium]|nr:MltA domain-containing protein [Paracoccaceae bacterium]MDG1738428.1 MltA domain-containing protein [Paracoccaceae bacterium]MDG2259825.1 MltA domain-containing protein [Paracoccaceae bacterium]